MATVKRILLSPLDWGLGHATRCIPLIQALLDNDCDVLLAASGSSIPLLKAEFPAMTILEIPGYNVKYGVNTNLAVSMARQMPRLFSVVVEERRQLDKIVAKYKPDAVISDNRYGFRSKRLPSVMICHQLHLQFPGYMAIPGVFIDKLHLSYLNRFDECWIPDYDTGALAGKLSFPPLEKTPCYYMGPLSRFEKPGTSPPEIKYDLAIVLSGPEPQRTIFEEMLLPQISPGRRILLVRGLPGYTGRRQQHPDITEVAHLDASRMKEALMNSEIVLSRPGYSGIMDFFVLQKNAILVPTPGQTEQENLARYHKEQKVFYSAPQKDFRLEDALQKSKDYSVKNISQPVKPVLKTHISNWLERINSY
jgi:uncharacterized protein (TIGR00661 family)